MASVGARRDGDAYYTVVTLTATDFVVKADGIAVAGFTTTART